MYHRSKTPATEKVVQQLLRRALEDAQAQRYVRAREVLVRRVYNGLGWECLEFTEGGGGLLASGVSWREAMNAALRWLHECAPGVDPWVEFRVGHPHHAPKDDDNV